MRTVWLKHGDRSNSVKHQTMERYPGDAKPKKFQIALAALHISHISDILIIGIFRGCNICSIEGYNMTQYAFALIFCVGAGCSETRRMTKDTLASIQLPLSALSTLAASNPPQSQRGKMGLTCKNVLELACAS